MSNDEDRTNGMSKTKGSDLDSVLKASSAATNQDHRDPMDLNERHHTQGRGSRNYRGGGGGRGRGRGRGGFGFQEGANRVPSASREGGGDGYVARERHPLESHLRRPFFDTNRDWWTQWKDWDLLLYEERARLRAEWEKEKAGLKEAIVGNVSASQAVPIDGDLPQVQSNGRHRPFRTPLDVYQPHRTHLSDRLHYAAADFRRYRPWPPQNPNPQWANPDGGEEKLLLGWIWDQIRLYMGLLGSTPVWNWVDPNAEGKDAPATRSEEPSRWGDISDDEDEPATNSDGDAAEYTAFRDRAKPPIPRRPYALWDYVPHTITRQPQLDCLLALSRFQKSHRLFRCFVDLERAVKIFLSSYIYEKQTAQAWTVVGHGKIGKIVACWLRFLLEGAGPSLNEGGSDEDEATIVMDCDQLPIPQIPSELQDITELESIGSEKLMKIFGDLVEKGRTAQARAAPSDGLSHIILIPLKSAIRRSIEVAEQSIVELQAVYRTGNYITGNLGGWCGARWGLAKWNENSGLHLGLDEEAPLQEKPVVFGPVPPPGFRVNKNGITVKVVRSEADHDLDLPNVEDLVPQSIDASRRKENEGVSGGSTASSVLSWNSDPSKHDAQSSPPTTVPDSEEAKEGINSWAAPEYPLPAEIETLLTQEGWDHGIVKQRNARRVKEIILSIESEPVASGELSANAVTARSVLERSYACLVLEPWLDWRYRFLPDIQGAGMLEFHRNEILIRNQTLNSENSRERTEILEDGEEKFVDPRLEDIVVLIENEVLKRCGLREGMGLVGTWGRIEVPLDFVVSNEKEKGMGSVSSSESLKLGHHRFWYVEKLDFVAPSYWVNDEEDEEDV